MKCALEIMAMKALAEQEYTIEQKKLDEQAKKNYEAMKENTRWLCNNRITNDFVKRAQNRRSLQITYAAQNGFDRLGNECFQLLTYTTRQYANRELSLAPSGCKYSLEELVNYLKANCFEVEISPHYYKTFGSGIQQGIYIKISVNPECAEG